MLKHNVKYVLVLAMLLNIATPAFAEDAPVYDLDNDSMQADNLPDTEVTGSPQPAFVQNQSPIVSSPPLSFDQRIARAEQQINTLQHTDASSKVETLQNELQSLRGQVEQLTHQITQIQNQQRTMYSDVDKRLSKQPSVVEKTPKTDVLPDETIPAESIPSKSTLKQTAASPIKNAAHMKTKEVITASDTRQSVKTDQQPNVAEEQQIYQTAYDFIKAKKYNNAISALQNMLRKYPTGQFAANAHYWLGELYGLLGKNDESAIEFSSVVKDYPDSPKVSDAQLKLGLIYAAQFKWPDAKTAFKKVVNHYPGTASARVASEQLRQIKIAGH